MNDGDLAARRQLVQKLCAELELGGELDVDCRSLHTIAASFRTPSRVARLTELDAVTLLHLRLPALTETPDGLTIIRQLSANVVTLELAGGARYSVPKSDLLRAAQGLALELAPTLMREGSFGARLAHSMLEHWRDLTKVALCALLCGGLSIVAPLVTGMVVDRALPQRAPKLLALLSGTVLFVATQRALFAWLQRRATLTLQTKLELKVTSSLFDHLLRIPYAVLASTQIGSWLETLRGAKRVHSALMDSLVPLLNLTMGLFQGIVLLQLDPRIAGAMMLGAGALLATSLAFALRASHLEQKAIETSAREHSTLYEVLDGLPTLRTCGASERGMMRWLDRLLATRAAQVRMDRLAIGARITMSSARDALSFGAFVWASYACLHGKLSVGEVISLSMVGDRFVALIGEFAGVLLPLWSARAHMARVDALLAQQNVVDQQPRAPQLSGRVDAVVLNDVWFRYGPDQPWVLQGYSLRVRDLEQFELRGPSGMGKSTILRLVAGLYRPERGSVRVYGQEPDRLRGVLCYLPQDARLLSGSILQNLRMLSGASHEALIAAAEASGLAELVKTFPMGFETVLPPGATTLSGGQRQLLVWTAAMASKRKLLLMDEALSSVDPLMRGRLLRMASDRARTIISVAHDWTHVTQPASSPDRLVTATAG